MKSRALFAVAIVLSLGLAPNTTSLAAMGGGYGGGGGSSGGGGSAGGGYGGEQHATRTVKACKKGQVLNKATHTCVIASHKAHKAYRPSSTY